MFARILLKSFRGRDSRLFVAFLAVVIATAVSAALLTIRADTGAKINVELRAYGANLALVPKESGENHTISVSDVTEYHWPASSDTVRGLVPVLYGIVNFVADSSLKNGQLFVALGTDLAAMKQVNSYWEIEPPLTRLCDEEILAGEAVARKLGLIVGQSVRLYTPTTGITASFSLAGIVRTGENEDDQVILSLSALQRLLALPDRVTLALASIHGGAAVVEKLAADISQTLPGISAKPIRKIATSESHVLQTVTLLMTIVAAFTVIVATLCLGTTMTALIVEREQEVGIMKAIGAENRHVAQLVAAELVLLGLSGGLVGYWGGVLFAQVISKNVFGAYASLRLEILPAVLLLALGISLAAAIFPLRRALQIEPTVALRGE
ncbi:FtsX-like permease family protein [candidate division KSB1 bacterium]|nr:FtsX-like permease family protein [candidate division KSB1 bacterium]